HVFAGLTTSDSLPDTFIACLASHNTPAIVFNAGSYDDADYLRWPDFYTLAAVSGSHWGFYVDDLVASGFLTKTSKIGLIRFDLPRAQRITDQVLKPRLAAHGMKATSEVTVRHIDSLAGLGDLATDDNNALLR